MPLGFLRGWASNEQCIARQSNIRNNVLDPGTQIIYKDRVADVIAALKSGEVGIYFYLTMYRKKAEIMRHNFLRDWSLKLRGGGLQNGRGGGASEILPLQKKEGGGVLAILKGGGGAQHVLR